MRFETALPFTEGYELKINYRKCRPGSFLRYDYFIFECRQACAEKVKSEKKKRSKRSKQSTCLTILTNCLGFTINENDGPTNHIIPSPCWRCADASQPFLQQQQQQSSLHSRKKRSKPSQCHWPSRKLFGRIRTVASRSRRILGWCRQQSPLVYPTKDHIGPI